jgi:UDP-N-acetylglucosamine/UDP-N-acetylgalactosamine diphosphorylase
LRQQEATLVSFLFFRRQLFRLLIQHTRRLLMLGGTARHSYTTGSSSSSSYTTRAITNNDPHHLGPSRRRQPFHCRCSLARRRVPPPTDVATMTDTVASLRNKCEAAGQAHLLAGLDDPAATDVQKQALARDLASLDFDFLKRALAGSLQAEKAGAVAGKGAGPPPPGAVLRLRDAAPEQRAEWRSLGLRMLSQGKAAVLLLAGGQGTRLGSDKPKGCFDVGLPSAKPLFALQAERLLKLQQLAAAAEAADGAAPLPPPKPIRWLVMTSPATHAETVAAFRDSQYWGLSPAQVTFFQQGSLPCLTEPEGQVILETPWKVARAPDGNGGMYAALLRGGGGGGGGGEGGNEGGDEGGDDDNDGSVLQLLESEGVEALDCYCVDNAAARVGDPEFLGYCASRGAGMGARVVAKASADERVGVFAATRGEGGDRGRPLCVLEYSELDPSLASAPAPASSSAADGDPYLFNWANICMHYFSVPWLRGAAERLAQAPCYHLARKAIASSSAAATGGSGGGGDSDRRVQGLKLEQFIFDPLPTACECEGGPGVALFEVERRGHFAPVKNAQGADSPATARAALLAQGAAWVRAAGGRVEEGGVPGGVEVSPLVSYAGEGLEERVRGRTFADGEMIG